MLTVTIIALSHCLITKEERERGRVPLLSPSDSTLSNQALRTSASERHKVLRVTSHVVLSGPGGGGSGRKPTAAEPRPGAARLTRRSG